MATVPYNPLQQVAPDRSMPTANVSAETFGAGVGNAARQVADRGADYATKQKMINNEAEAKDADMAYQRELQTLGFDPEKGYFSRLGKSALDDYKNILDAATSARQRIANGMNNPGARNLFERAAAAHELNFQDSMDRHAIQQRKLWLVGTSDARANETVALAANYFNDDKRFNQAVATARDEAYQQGDLQGWSDEQKAVAARAYESKAWVLRITKQNQFSPIKAADMFNANQAKLDPVAAAQLGATLKQSVIPVQTRQLVDAVMNGAPSPSATLVDAVRKAESGGRQFGADGKLLESPKGAKGDMQVLDSTNASPGFGVDPAKDDTPEERSRVGRDYLKAMLQRYGNQTMALAAYNWGPARVDALAEKGFDPRLGGEAEQLFMAKLPDETRAYVAKINKDAPPIAGKPPTSQDIDANMQGWMAQVKASAAAMWPDDPVAQDQAVAQLVQSVNVIQTGNNANERANRDLLVSGSLGFVNVAGNITQLPVGDRPKTLTDLLKLPGQQDAWNASDPQQQKAILGLLEQNAKGENPASTPEAFAKYYQLVGLSVNDPVAFRGVNMADPELIKVLPQQWTLHLIGMQQAMSTREMRDVEKGANLTSAINLAKSTGLLRDAGINASAKPDTSDAEKFNRFTGQLSMALDQFVATEKRQPTQKDQRGIIARLLTEGYQQNSGILWDERKRLFENTDPKTWRAFVPPEVKQRLFDVLKDQLGHEPSEQEMIDNWTQRVRAMRTKQ